MKINEVLMQLLLYQPFYGNIAAALASNESIKIPELKTTYFPNPMLHYNKKWFEELDNDKAQGAVIHELLHLILLHPFRRCERDLLLWETACDMAVNEYIPPSQLSELAVTVEKVEKEIGSQLDKKGSAEYYYQVLSELDDGIGFLDSEDKIHIRIGVGQEMTVNKQSEDSSDASMVGQRAIESMMFQLLSESSEESGLVDELMLQVDDIYKEYHVDWRNIFKRFLIGRGRINSRRSYKRESRRHQDFPGNKRSIGLKCLLAIDESGSIKDNQIVEFYNEIIGINRITSAEIYVTEFDISCTVPVPIGSYKLQPKRVKSGGTDFRPVFELADKLRIELLVIFTDGDGTAPELVNQRVLWVLTKGGKKPCEHGFTVELQ